MVRKRWGWLIGGLGVGRGPQTSNPAPFGESLPVSCLSLLKLVLPEHGVGLRAGQERGPVVSFKMGKASQAVEKELCQGFHRGCASIHPVLELPCAAQGAAIDSWGNQGLGRP